MAARHQRDRILDGAERRAKRQGVGSSVDETCLFLSVLTLAEYDKGIANLADDDPRRRRYIAMRDALEAGFDGRILPLGDRAVRRWGEISGRVRRETGHPPPVIDMLLAATAMEAGLYLVSRNGKALRHSGAVVFDPWTDDMGAFPLSPLGRRRRAIDPD
ncbi:putative nucleic acid-binding protein [Labrys wisconsinensis]|uniref:Nucleic acid-binding protein n=1 Tax=Labrys wisconsinensis TaxID=425677 RepID=A0ABU0J808_9HYPH|nr:putative nucleic acid-binding protein [Labrys wisconsinensis]